ncbi:MAG: 50S ribosomal protein L32 [Ignavibacteriae bacterium]|jgi:large subunit ribosomal protein L32|nr:50S ribosomal protein L32 [Ignavibacteriota bacterium]NOG98724.1 50S ribosomal protein L32 [Ignavibacteriota bacterium]
MAHPKRKISKTRRDKRRTHYKATAPGIATCANCGDTKLSHRACPSCGYYAGRSMFVPES